MATSTADILRDREQDQQDKPPDFGALATAAGPSLEQRMAETERELGTARQERKQAGDAEVAALTRRKEGMAPVIAQTQAAIGSPLPPPPAPTVLPTPPSRGLHDFLAPTEGEQPENTISKLIQGISLMATGFTGLARGDATAALASMKGALAGWQEGDKQRADRAFSDWRAQTDKLLQEADSRHQTYQEIFANKKLSTEQQLQMLKLAGEGYGHDIAIGAAARANATEALKELDGERNHLDRLKADRDRLTEMAHQKELDREYKLALEQIAAQKKEQDKNAVLDQYTPEAIDALAWSAIKNEGRVPSVGMGASGQIVRGKVLSRVAEIAAQNNIPLSSLPGIAAEMKGWQANINTAGRNLAYWNANIDTFHKHVKQFLALSEGTERGQSPAINRYILKAKGQYAGDAEVAAYEAMANEIAMEYAKLAVGTAQGDAASREEARGKINASLNPAQVRRVLEELVKAGENRKQSWQEAMKQGTDAVSSFGGRISSPLPPGDKTTVPPTLRFNPTSGKLEPVK